MTTYDIAASCPYCLKRVDSARFQGSTDQSEGPPDPGSLNFCNRCGEVSEYYQVSPHLPLVLIKLTEKGRDYIARHPELANMITELKAFYLRHPDTRPE